MNNLLVYILSFIFASLIIYHLNLVFSKPLIEGVENNDYKEYSGNDPLILAKQNAGNIQFLKQKFDTINDLSNKVTTLEQTVDSNTESIAQIVKNLKEQTDKLSGADSS